MNSQETEALIAETGKETTSELKTTKGKKNNEQNPSSSSGYFSRERLKGGSIGGGTGALIGGIVGSVIPGAGTAIGIVAGSAIGAAIGATKGTTGLKSKEETKKML